MNRMHLISGGHTVDLRDWLLLLITAIHWFRIIPFLLHTHRRLGVPKPTSPISVVESTILIIHFSFLHRCHQILDISVDAICNWDRNFIVILIMMLLMKPANFFRLGCAVVALVVVVLYRVGYELIRHFFHIRSRLHIRLHIRLLRVHYRVRMPLKFRYRIIPPAHLEPRLLHLQIIQIPIPIHRCRLIILFQMAILVNIDQELWVLTSPIFRQSTFHLLELWSDVRLLKGQCHVPHFVQFEHAVTCHAAFD